MKSIILFSVILGWFAPEYTWARCAPDSLGTKQIEWVIISVTSLKSGGCGVISKNGAIAWSDNQKVCVVKSGETINAVLSKECCDATYDWCDETWTVSGKQYRANGNRILNPKGNRTF